VNFLPKIRVEVAVSSDRAAKTVEAITAAARTGLIGVAPWARSCN
jgi:nitrogen regulatory protein P-II 2